MLIFQSADLKTAISADLPLTYRRPTADLPLTSPPPKGGVPTGSLPHGGTSTTDGCKLWFSIGLEACRTIARQRWGRCTAFRMGIVAGEIGARIVNPYRGKQASLFREGLRRSRPTRAQAGVKSRELGVRLDWGLGYWEVLG